MSRWRVWGRILVKRTLASRMAVVALAGLAGLGAAVMASSSPAPVAPGQQIETIDLLEDPLAKFSKLMPVLSHDRCANCHGAVDPFTGFDHEGGQLEPALAAPLIGSDGDQMLGTDFNGPCTASGCHSAPGARFWALAPKKTKFAGQTASAICHEIQLNSRFNKADVLRRHLGKDELILAAFIGQKGFPDRPADSPRMPVPEFLRLADEWLKGSEDIPCSGWTGTITQTETVNLKTTHGNPGLGLSSSTTETQTATRTVTVTIDGGVSVEINLQATDSIENTIAAPGCTTTSRSVATIGPKSGKATIGEAPSAKILFTQGGKYSVSIQGPDELNERIDRSTLTQCFLGELSEEPETKDLPHVGWTIDFDGILVNPSNRTVLKSTSPVSVTRTGDDAWLTGSGGVVRPFQIRDNGEDLPVEVKVTTTWDLRRLQ